MREATPLLDSAIALSRSSYGASSEQFVLANLEAGRAALHRNNIARAYAMVDSASVALIRDGKRASELFARTLVDRASIAFVAGEYAIVQRDADGALAMETHRTAQPTMVKAIALNRLGSMAVVSGMLFRGDTLYRQSIDLMRAMHATQNLELLDVLSNAQSVARSLGQTARADSLMNSGVRIASETFGVDSREMALMLAGRVELELAHHDTGAATASSARAIRIVDSLPDVVLPVRIIARFSAVMLALARHDLRGASSTLDRIIAIAGNASRGAPLVQVLMVHCSILTSLGRYDAAHATCKRAVTVHDSSGMVMPYFRMTLHSEQARVYAHRGDWASVTRELASFTPQQDSAIRRYIAAELAAKASRK